ncbi:MAG: hypothetical protein L3J87_05310, partial [Thermoplasmata archaeon]|nr:hypothetical protein [Thermoplasmata archaeon]
MTADDRREERKEDARRVSELPPPRRPPGSERCAPWFSRPLARLVERSRIRAKPERVFVVVAAVWLLVNVAPWGFGTDYLYSFYLAFTFQKSDVIFPFTYAFAVGTFAVLMSAGLRRTTLGPARTFLIAGTVPFAGPGAFEIIFQEAGHYLHPGLFLGYAQPYVM